MTITLVPAPRPEAFETPALRTRAALAPRLSTTHLFRAMSGGAELGLVVLDIHDGADCFILYELFLCPERRNRGVGTEVLSVVERHVEASGRACLEVWPHTLDRKNRSDAQLVRWYRRHGYETTSTGSRRLRKRLRPR